MEKSPGRYFDPGIVQKRDKEVVLSRTVLALLLQLRPIFVPLFSPTFIDPN